MKNCVVYILGAMTAIMIVTLIPEARHDFGLFMMYMLPASFCVAIITTVLFD